jgi:hypothetical protein
MGSVCLNTSRVIKWGIERRDNNLIAVCAETSDSFQYSTLPISGDRSCVLNSGRENWGQEKYVVFYSIGYSK